MTTGTAETVWAEYAATLASLPGSPLERVAMLQGLLADVSARLESENRRLISQSLLEYAQRIDQPVLRSTTRERPSPPARGARESSPQRAPWELMVGTSRLGPRLAGKLVMASARAQSRKR